MPIVQVYPCSNCGVRYALWEMVFIGSTSKGHVYICMPCHS